MTKCLNGWSKRFESIDSHQILNFRRFAEYLSGGLGDPYINDALEALNDENYKVFQQALALLRYDVRKVRV